MSTIADGECFASNIPQALPSPVVCETYAIIFADGTKGWGASVDWADYDCSGDSDVVKCVRISWMGDGALMPGDQKFTDVAKLAADCDHFSDLSLNHIEEFESLAFERDEVIARAEAAEAEVSRCKAEYARLRGLWLDQVDTLSIYQPVVDAAVTWGNQFGDGERAMQRLFEAVRALQSARPKAFYNKNRSSHIDDLGTKTEAVAQQGPSGEEEWVLLDLNEGTPVDRAFAEAVDLLDGAHQPKSDKSCATCRHMDGEMCELSGAMAEACLDNNFLHGSIRVRLVRLS